jgi:hypothetical protein
MTCSRPDIPNPDLVDLDLSEEFWSLFWKQRLATVSASSSVPMKQRKASSGVRRIGSPRMLTHSSLLLERRQQGMETWIGLGVPGLDARRIDMSHRQDF